MPNNKFIGVSDHGHVLVSGPLFDWLTEQDESEVSLPYSPPVNPDSSLRTQPFQYLRWKMILYFDDEKRGKQAWRLEPDGHLPDDDAMQFIEENF